MAKYLLLKHYRGAPAPVNDVPMDQWTPEEISAHIQFMNDWAARLEGTGEFIDGQALAPEGAWVRYDGEGRPPVTDNSGATSTASGSVTITNVPPIASFTSSSQYLTTTFTSTSTDPDGSIPVIRCYIGP